LLFYQFLIDLNKSRYPSFLFLMKEFYIIDSFLFDNRFIYDYNYIGDLNGFYGC
jgi:hypothetical protein